MFIPSTVNAVNATGESVIPPKTIKNLKSDFFGGFICMLELNGMQKVLFINIPVQFLLKQPVNNKPKSVPAYLLWSLKGFQHELKFFQDQMIFNPY